MLRTRQSSVALLIGLAASLLGAGCSSQEGFGVELTLRFADSVPDDALAQVTTLSIVSSGDETAIYPLPIGRKAARTEQLIFRPLATSRTLNLAVSALEVDPDAQTSQVLAEGRADAIALQPDHLVPIEISLGTGAGPDAGANDDLGDKPDLSSGEGGVVMTFADLAAADLSALPSKCATSPAMLCESFEGAIGSAWATHMTNGTLTEDTSRAYRGARSLHLHTNLLAAGVTADVRIAEQTTLTGGVTAGMEIYVRAFYYIPKAPVNGVQLFSAVQVASPYLGVSTFDSAGGFLATGDTISGGGFQRSATAMPPTDRWFCLEWHVHVADGLAGLEEVWMDGAAVTDLHINQPTNPPTPLGVLSVGYKLFAPANANPASDAWVDEIAVDNTRIGCDK